MTGKTGKSYEKGKTYKHSDGKRYLYLGQDEKGQHKWQGNPAKKSEMGNTKMKPKTNYKSTGSKKGKPKKRKSLM